MKLNLAEVTEYRYGCSASCIKGRIITAQLLLFFEVILPFANGCLSKVNGVLGAAVIAAHAVGAMAVPAGAAILHCDVLERAVLCTYSAGYAIIRYTELAVGYEKAVEQGLKDIGFKERRAALQVVKVSF